nr:flavoprotein [Frankia sp. ArI3]
MTADGRVLYLVACGGYPAAELPAFVEHARSAGWDVCVIATPAAMAFLDAGRLAELTGHPVRSAYKRPGEPDVLPPADAFVVAPATFNTVNKIVAGISDTLALGLLNEALGAGLPIIMAPYPEQRPGRSPRLRRERRGAAVLGRAPRVRPARRPARWRRPARPGEHGLSLGRPARRARRPPAGSCRGGLVVVASEVRFLSCFHP